MKLFGAKSDAAAFSPTRPGPIAGRPGRQMRNIVDADASIAAEIGEDETVRLYACAQNRVVVVTDRRVLLARKEKLEQVALADLEAVLMRSRATIYTVLFEPPTAGLDMIRFGASKADFEVAISVRDTIRGELAKR